MTGVRKKGDWLASVAYPIVVVLMEAFWIFPWVVWLGLLSNLAELRPPVSMMSVIAVLAVSLSVTSILHRREWRLAYIRILIIGCGAVVMLLVLRIEYGNGYRLFDRGWAPYFIRLVGASFSKPDPSALAIPVILCLWWRGILLGRTTVYFENIYRSFIIGIAALIVLIVVWRMTPDTGWNEDALSTIGLYVLAFFFFGLTALVIRNIYTMRERMAKKETRTSVWRSFPLMLGVIGGIVAVGIIAATISSPEFLYLMAKGFRFLWDIVIKAAFYVAIPLKYLAAAIFWVLEWLVHLIRNPEAREMEGTSGSPLDDIGREIGKMPQVITTILEALAITVVIALAVFILARSIKRFQARRDEEAIDEIHESLWSKEDFKNDLRQFLKTIGDRFKRAPKPAPVSYHDDADVLSVREIYKRLLWEADRSGVTRLKHETPSEYAKRLVARLSDGMDQLAELTELYSRVRYGEIDPQGDQVDRANGIWPILRSCIRRIGEPVTVERRD